MSFLLASPLTNKKSWQISNTLKRHRHRMSFFFFSSCDIKLPFWPPEYSALTTSHHTPLLPPHSTLSNSLRVTHHFSLLRCQVLTNPTPPSCYSLTQKPEHLANSIHPGRVGRVGLLSSFQKYFQFCQSRISISLPVLWHHLSYCVLELPPEVFTLIDTSRKRAGSSNWDNICTYF